MNPAALAALMNGDIDNALAAATPGGIEAQEKQGQTDFVNSTQVPKDFNGGTKEQFEELGFVFGEEADDIFINCTLPKGWSKKASDHDMWSYIIDGEGVERVSIFYKVAFYDRSAHMNLKEVKPT